MAHTDTVDESRRGLTFGAVADAYDRYRPTYPPELVSDVVALLPGPRVVEIGAGTGIATGAFLAHSVEMTCVEPDAGMAAVLSRKYPQVTVEVNTFEGWSAARAADARRFHGLISGQAWHWTAPQTRWIHAAAALRSGGVVALFWNRDDYADPGVREVITEAYDKLGIEDRAVQPEVEEEVHGWPSSEIEASPDLGDHEVRVYRWTRRQSVVDHVARLNTVSAHLILPAETRTELTRDLIESLTAYAGDEIELAMRTDLALARRR